MLQPGDAGSADEAGVAAEEGIIDGSPLGGDREGVL
jgi:hypothetical protein